MTNEELFSKSRSEWERIIDEHIIGKNAERNRKILKLKLLDGVTHEKIAEEIDISVIQVKRVVRDGTETISRHVK